MAECLQQLSRMYSCDIVSRAPATSIRVRRNLVTKSNAYRTQNSYMLAFYSSASTSSCVRTLNRRERHTSSGFSLRSRGEFPLHTAGLLSGRPASKIVHRPVMKVDKFVHFQRSRRSRSEKRTQTCPHGEETSLWPRRLPREIRPNKVHSTLRPEVHA